MSSRSTAASRGPVDGVLDAIGGTPLVRLRRLLDRGDVEVYAKVEAMNPGGSAKDRPAAAMVRAALADGLVAPGGTIVESSSGNMGVGLAQACRYHGLRLICVVDERTTDVNVATLRALGADVRVVRRPDPATGDLLAARLALVRHLVDTTPDAYWPDQYGNPANPQGTMREIDEALDGALDVLLVATSTTGTLGGCRAYLRAHGRSTAVVAVDAVGSALFGGARADRRIPGFGAGVETALSRETEPERVLRVDELETVVGCRRLVDREAIFAGGSSGAVAAAAELLAAELRPGARMALILADGGRGYLSTVYDDAWVQRELGCPPDRLRGLVDGTATASAAA